MPEGLVTKHHRVNQIQAQSERSICACCQKLAVVRETAQFSGQDVVKEPQIIGKTLACFMHL